MSDLAASKLLAILTIALAIWVPLFQVLAKVKVSQSSLIVDDWKLARAFVFAKQASNDVYGGRLFSMRAIGVSFMMTLFLFVTFQLLAFGTSSSDFGEEYILKPIISWQSFSAVFLLCWLLSAIVDFLSVVQTRYFLRFITVEMNALVLIGLLVLDVIVSLVIFIVTIPFVVNIGYIAALVIYDEKISVGDLATAFQTIGYETLAQFFFQDVANLTSQIFYHPLSNFGHFSVLDIGCGNGTMEFCFQYPYTTFLATNFSTSVWLWFTSLAAVLVRVVIFEKRFSDAAARIRVTKRMLVYSGIFLSLLAGFTIL